LLALAAISLLLCPPVSALEIVGASTIQPIMKQLLPLIERAENEAVTLRGGGSAAGAAAVTDGRAEIGMVSRPLNDEERSRRKHEVIGYDALAIVVNQANPLSGLSKSQLIDIFAGRTGNWKELGGPDRPIVLVSKEVGRSTLELFEQYTGLLSPKRAAGEAMPRISSKAHIIGSNLESLTLVGGLPGAIGYVSVGTAHSMAAAGLPIRILKLEGSEPSPQSIANGSYPIIRELNLVFRARTARVDRLLHVMHGDEGIAVLRQQGFLPPVGPPGSRP